MATALPANVNLNQLLAASPGTTIVGTEPLESVQSGTSVAFTLNQVLAFAQANFSVGNLAAISGLSVLGVVGTASAVPAPIVGTTDQVLCIAQNGTTLTFGPINLATDAAVTGTLGVSHGGTGIGSGLNSHGVLLGNGLSPIGHASVGAAGRVLVDQGASADPVFAALNLASSAAVTGTLGLGFGGTGQNLAQGLISGGSTILGLTLSTVANFGVFVGTGAPTLSAATSSLYLRNDATGTTTRLYINLNGATTWTAVAALA